MLRACPASPRRPLSCSPPRSSPRRRAPTFPATPTAGSTRAAVEGLVARAALPLGEIRDVLPERAAGPIAPRGDPGGAIEPGPLPERLARAEKRAKSEGAAHIVRASLRASIGGAGEFD